MPQRRGFFGRLLNFLGIGESAEPAKETPPEPAPSPPLGSAPSPHEQEMRDIYRQVRGDAHDPRNLTDYSEWREIYDPMSVVFDDDAETEEGWDEYLRAYYLTTDEPGHVTREQFHNDTNIPRSAQDWDLWKEIKRGTT